MKNITVILVLVLFMGCIAREDTNQSETIPVDTPEVKTKSNKEDKVTIVHLGRDTFKALVKPPLFDSFVDFRQDVEKKAHSFCQGKKLRFRPLEWSELKSGYQYEFRCL